MISSVRILAGTVAVAGAVSAFAAQAPQTVKPVPGATSAPELFTVQSDAHPIAVWARRPASPKGAVLFVHGRTWSGRPDFDLQVTGLRRSVLMSFASQGFAAYAIDLRGYGSTPRDATGWLTPKRGATDISNVLAWIATQHPSLPKPTLVGWSRGAAMAGMVAVSAPDRLTNVVLFGFAFDPELEFGDGEAAEKPDKMRNTAAAAASDFISPRITPRQVVSAFVEQALAADPVLADLKNDGEFNGFKPALLTTPILIMFGSDDPGVSAEDAGKMLAAVKTPDKQLVVLPGADHAAHLEDTHDAWVAAIVNFINRPPARR
ncbi:MAG TPA: alpha/beta fold hydrolase [Vicinamibacterales bacterium]|nr:alpha/beta fold hydrolase [Vicinamibacterales bacterium]